MGVQSIMSLTRGSISKSLRLGKSRKSLFDNNRWEVRTFLEDCFRSGRRGMCVMGVIVADCPLACAFTCVLWCFVYRHR